jgi:S-DNA-T family DNA segregation ATPase FtsK/SpoIIIE
MVGNALRLIAGTGAYAIPVLLLFAGSVFLAGYRRFSFTHSSIGALLLFLTFVTWRHIVVVHDPGNWTGEQVRSAGGWVGGLFGAMLVLLCGKPISHMFLMSTGLIGVVLVVDQPLLEIVQNLRDAARERAAAASRKLDETSKKRVAAAEKRSADRKAKQIAAPESTDRAVRAAKVVERALESAEPVRAAEGDTDAASSGKLRSLFKRGGKEEVAEEIEVKPAEKAPRQSRREKVAAPSAEADPLDVKAGDQLQLGVFMLPPLTLLKESPPSVAKRTQAELTDKIQILEQTLEQFNIGANVVEVASGPSVTRYEIQLAPGIKVSKIVSLADNLAMNLAAIDVRVEAPIPGKAAIGVEVPNTTPVMVSLRECLDTDEFRNAPSKLTIALGKDVAGQYKYADLTKMPHLLIGGSTNSGKSVCLNTLIASLVYRGTPRDVRLLMIDPKRVELSLWDGIPHLMHPVVKDVKQAAGLLRSTLREMDRRYDLFAAVGTRNIDGYNQKAAENEQLPYIVLIIDELADLMMQQGPEVETSICRLAQLARATGIHLVIATQRPSVDIITGTIKANISSRIAFAVASQVDSRTILDMPGADRLIGRGDMLFMPIDASKPLRVQGCYLSEAETNTLVDYLKEQEKPTYTLSVADGSGGSGGGSGGGSADEDVDDEFFEQAVRLVVNNGQASTSMLQRRFRIGYTRAARIVEVMEERGIVGGLNGAKPREILVSKDEVERLFNPAFLPGVDDYEDDGE